MIPHSSSHLPFAILFSIHQKMSCLASLRKFTLSPPPSPPSDMRLVCLQCFQTDGKLVVDYALMEAWG
jgi:hypothetical protein